MSKPTAEELEAIIRFDEAGDECSIWIASERVAARLAKAGLEVTTESGGWVAELPRQALRVKTGNRACYIGGCSAKIHARWPSRMRSASPKLAKVRNVRA